MQTVVTNIHVRHDAREFLIFCFYRMRAIATIQTLQNTHTQHRHTPNRDDDDDDSVENSHMNEMENVRRAMCKYEQRRRRVQHWLSVALSICVLSCSIQRFGTEYWLCVWSHQIVMREENISFVYSVSVAVCAARYPVRVMIHSRCWCVVCCVLQEHFWFFACHVLMWLKQSILNSDRHISSVRDRASFFESFSVFRGYKAAIRKNRLCGRRSSASTKL